jgi:hypothetical protein
MLKKVKTKSSAPGRASVSSGKIEKKNVLDIFSGSDEDSTENSKAFDNPQEERGYDSSEGTKVSPDMPLAEPGNPGRAGALWNNPNFSVNTGNIKKKPSQQLGMKSLNLSDKANTPLTDTSTRDGSITNLGSTKMSKAVVEKYPGANEIATSNASYPSDFKNQMSPIKSGFTNSESFNHLAPAKNSIFQSVQEIPFEKSNDFRKTMKDQSDTEIGRLMNPEIQGDTFTEQARTSIPGDFLTSSDISPQKVASNYASQTGEAGKGQFPQSKEASSTLTQKSSEAAHISSPQRASDSLEGVDGKSTFKGGEKKDFSVNTDMSVKDKVRGSANNDLASQGTNTSSLGQSSKSFFVSNFSIVPDSIGSGINQSTASTDSVSSAEFPSSL